jgi:sec-independent protein translocase protein TatC
MNSPDDPKGAGRASSGVASFPTSLSLLEKIRARLGGGSGGTLPPPPPGRGADDEDEEEGMLRMSFLDHLQELRSRIIKMFLGLMVAFLICLTFCNQVWKVVSDPAVAALTTLGVNPPHLHTLTPMEGFTVIWWWMPVLCSVFVASPWILYQVWAFIAPGLYKRERRYAVPFVLSSAGLFLLGGAFAYFIVFRYALTFLLGIGMGNSIDPVVSVSAYFDLFVNVMLGVSLVFEMPILIFFLTLLRLASPAFLLRHSRYAILAIFIIAAIVTPTPDVFNLMLFAVPMCMLFFVGIFASYLLVLHREGRTFPWRTIVKVALGVLLLLALALYLATTRFGYVLVPHWPFITH